MNWRTVGNLLKETSKEWNEDKASRLAAGLAYYAIFSLAPLLIIVIAIAGLVFGEDAAKGQIVGQIQNQVGKEAAGQIQTMLVMTSQKGTGTFATIIGIVTLLLGATGVFGQLQDALNTIWEVAPKPGRGVFGLIRDRFLSFAAVLGIGLLLLASLILSALLAAFITFAHNLLPGLETLLEILNTVFSFGVITLMIAMIYVILPDVKIAWRDVWVGSATTALLFTIGKTLIEIYLGRVAVGSAYGAAGSLVVILVWVNYSAQILLFGAELTHVYAKRYGSGIVPTKNAVLLTLEDRVHQGIPPTQYIEAVAQAQDGRPAAENIQTADQASDAQPRNYPQKHRSGFLTSLRRRLKLGGRKPSRKNRRG